MASRTNESWHKAHVMPKHATVDQRIEWHLQHQANCACRPMPVKLRERIENGARSGPKKAAESRRIGRH